MTGTVVTGAVYNWIVTGFDVAGLPDLQVSLEVSTQVTTSVDNGVYVNTALFALPALFAFAPLLPFTSHWYAGVSPPFTGVAVKVTGVPRKIVPDGTAAIETLTGSSGLTVVVTEADPLHPSALVTVTVKAAAELTEMVCVVAPVDQA